MRRRCAILIVLASLLGCGRSGEPENVGSPPRNEADPRELLTCPVEGTEFQPPAGVAATANGKTVLVCSPGCRWRLEADPSRFLDKAEER